MEKNLKNNGVEVVRGEKEGAKSITFEYQEKKFRGSKLDDRYSSFDRINQTLEQERPLKRLQELNNSRELEKEPSSKLEELANKLREKELEQEREKAIEIEKARQEELARIREEKRA